MMRKTLLIPLLLLATSAHAAPNDAQQKKLTETLATLSKTKDEQAALAKRQAEVEAELARLQTRSAEIAERLQVAERRVSNEESALVTASGKLSAKGREFEARKAEYAATVATLLRLRNLPMTTVFAQPEDVHQLLRTGSVLEETNKAVAEKAKALRRDLIALKELKSDAKEKRTRTAVETAALNAEQAKLDKALAEREKLQASIAADRKEAEAKIAKLSKESESLQTLLKKLDVEEKAEEARAKQPAKSKSTKRFDSAKGTLRPPVSGDVVHRYGEKKSANETYRGTVIRARSGATVVAPYDGEVVFTGPFRDYGNMLLIKHSNGYISLVAGLGKINTRLNQTVIRGEPVALTATGTMPEIYVELRDSDAKPIDPGDWFAKLAH
jgi:septal ring factor EnvC (AmiA/AmiB activator)